MKFLCCVLILCLSFVLNIYSQTITEKTTSKISTPTINVVEDTEIKDERGQLLPGTKKEDTFTNINPESLAKLLSQLVEFYNDLGTKYTQLANQYEGLSTKLDNIMKGQLELIGTKQESTTSEQITQQPQTQEEIQTPEVQEQKLSSKKEISPQYVKLKFKDKGKEVEFFLDPMYVNMDFNLTRSTVPKEQEVKFQSPQIKEYREEKIEEEKTTEIKEEKTTGITEEVLENIYKAQKLFYEKQYKPALNEIKKSIRKKETALARALEGSIYFTLGDIDSAIDAWKRSLELNPDMEDVREILEKYKVR